VKWGLLICNCDSALLVIINIWFGLGLIRVVLSLVDLGLQSFCFFFQDRIRLKRFSSVSPFLLPKVFSGEVLQRP
jgi:hypothetical protein